MADFLLIITMFGYFAIVIGLKLQLFVQNYFYTNEHRE